MKVTSIRTQAYRFELKRPCGDANNPRGWRRGLGLAVFVDTDEGITGNAVTACNLRQDIVAFGSCLIGQDPRGVRGLWKRMVDQAFKGGAEGYAAQAIAALDIALWDIKAKANNEPLWRTLGASIPRVKVYASGIDLPLLSLIHI